jgi:hypothetical protein
MALATELVSFARRLPGETRGEKLANLARYRQTLRGDLDVLEVIRGQLEEHPGPEAWPEGIEDRIRAALAS